MTTLYLASTSPARRQIIADIGLSAEILTPDVDEEAVVEAMPTPHTASDIALHLAMLKARSVLSPEVDGLVIGGDSVFEIDGELHGKPLTEANAKARWRQMRGSTGVLSSGLWVIDHTGGELQNERGEVSSARVHFAADIGDDEIDAYIATGEPLPVAGAFTLDSRGAALIDQIEGDSWAVVGMSAASLRRLIRGLGHSFIDLWR
jgi:septum formation protein